jgi:dynein heavy chain, axonemal
LKAWREDLKRILMATGLDAKPTMFLFSEAQIIHEQMLEDINSVLNSGDVTGLYPEKELDEIMNACKSDCLRKGLQPNKMNIFAQYLGRVNQNIHIVLAMSPLSQAFSTRLRMFPSLVNCCTLDWFSEWPEEALIAVGRGQLKEFLLDHNIDIIENNVLETFKTVHKSVEKISVDYL